MSKLPELYETVVPGMLRILERGVSMPSVRAVANDESWPEEHPRLGEFPAAETERSVSYRIPAFQFFVVQRDALLVDHACLFSCANRQRSLDDMFFAAQEVLLKVLGAPEFDGIWPPLFGSAPGCDFRVSIWRHGSGLLLLQQDDFEHLRFPELIGFEVDICLLNWDRDREVPSSRDWRFESNGA